MKKIILYFSIILLISILYFQFFSDKQYRNEIIGNCGTLNLDGAVFHLSNGISVEIPANSFLYPGEVNFIIPDCTSETTLNNKTFKINSKCYIRNLIVSVPINPDTLIDNVTALCYLYDSTNSQGRILSSLYPNGIIHNSNCIFIINTSDLSFNLPSPNSKTFTQPAIINSPTASLDSLLFIFEELPNTNPDVIQCLSNIKKHQLDNSWPSLKWPFYRSFINESWASAWLMLLKGYNNDLPDYFDSVNKIVNYTKMPIDKNITLYNIINFILGYKDIDSFYFPLYKNESIASISQKILGSDLIARYCFEKSFIVNVINQLEKGIPIMAYYKNSNVIITGYKYTGSEECNLNNLTNNIEFVLHNPNVVKYEKNYIYSKLPFSQLFEKSENETHCLFIIHYFLHPTSNKTPNYKTIQLSEIKSNRYNLSNKCGFYFLKNNKTLAWTNWDVWFEKDFSTILNRGNYDLSKWNGQIFLKELSPDAYNWLSVGNGLILNSQINDFDNICLKNISIYDTSNFFGNLPNYQPQIMISFYPLDNFNNDNEIVQAKSGGINSGYMDECIVICGYDFFDIKTNDNINIGDKFRTNIKTKTNCIIRVALNKESSTERTDLTEPINYYDKFDLKFTYNPSQN